MKKKMTDAMMAKAKQYTASMKGGGKKKMTVGGLMAGCK
jgi:hypothetical protein